MDYFCFFRCFSNSSDFLSLFPLFSAVVFIVLQTFLKRLINAGCHLGCHTTAGWEGLGRTLEHEGAGMSLWGGPLSAGGRDGAQCQLRHWPTRGAEGHGPLTASGSTRPLHLGTRAVQPREQLLPTGGAPGEGPGPSLPWEAGPCGQEGVSRLLPGPGGGSHNQTP